MDSARSTLKKALSEAWDYWVLEGRVPPDDVLERLEAAIKASRGAPQLVNDYFAVKGLCSVDRP